MIKPFKMNYSVTDKNIHVSDSYACTKNEMKGILDEMRGLYPDNNVLIHRKNRSLIREWCLHNALYKMGLFKSHTKDVDLDYPQKWYEKIAYFVFGGLVSLFMK